MALIGLMLGFITICLGMIPVTHIALMFGDKLGPIFSIEKHIIHTCVVGCYIIAAATTMCFAPKITTRRIREKLFHKKHPNLDIKINTKELNQKLKEYNQLSKKSVDIGKTESAHLNEKEIDSELAQCDEFEENHNHLEKQKEKHLENYSEVFKQMTVGEKLAFLNQEKEFWEQVAIEEKYQNEGEDTTGQVGIGRVQDSNEDKNKVYHI